MDLIIKSADGKELKRIIVDPNSAIVIQAQAAAAPAMSVVTDPPPVDTIVSEVEQKAREMSIDKLRGVARKRLAWLCKQSFCDNEAEDSRFFSRVLETVFGDDNLDSAAHDKLVGFVVRVTQIKQILDTAETKGDDKATIKIAIHALLGWEAA